MNNLITSKKDGSKYNSQPTIPNPTNTIARPHMLQETSYIKATVFISILLFS